MDWERTLQQVTISGSYRKFPDEVALALGAFQDVGVTVLSPKSATILASIDGFVSLEGDVVPRIDRLSENDITTAMKRIENSHLQAIQRSDALWVVIPTGYCGGATAFEIGWALAHNVPVFCDQASFGASKEPIIRAYASPTKGIEYLVNHFDAMPPVDPVVSKYFMKSLLESKMEVKSPAPSPFNAAVAVGPVLVDFSDRQYTLGQARDILLVRTHKWKDKFSIIGGRVKPGEKLAPAFSRVMAEQTGLQGVLGDDICVFDEIPDSGYVENGTSRIFVDKVVRTSSRLVELDARAQEYVWVPPEVALRELDIEPNARKTIELYEQSHCQFA